MKSFILSLAMLITVEFSYAQTNTFPSTGSVGIGTTSPAALLDVGKLLNVGELGSVLGRLDEGNVIGAGTYLGVKGYDTQPSVTFPNIVDIKSFSIEHSFYGEVNNSINFLRGSSRTGGSISFNTDNNTEKMRILYNGNVGIGTSTPDELLSVNGTIHSKEVKVNLTGWPDYVFKPSYHLPTLTEVKTYIDLNQHLPEIPSEQEVTRTGLNLGEMNKLLLKKIEELTLYLIQENKEKEAQQMQIQIQQNQINELKQQFDLLSKKILKN